MAAKTIMLVCAAGMSTSLLVRRMQKAQAQTGVPVTVFAVAAATLDQNLAQHHPDLILLGPQVGFMLRVVRQKTHVPVRVIDIDDFGAMDGAKVLAAAWRVLVKTEAKHGR